MVKKQTTAVIESDQPPELREDIPHFLIPTPDTPLSRCPTTIDLTSELGKAQLINAMGTPDVTVDPQAPVKLSVVGYIVYPASAVDEQTGELKQFNRTVFLLADGTTFSTTSEVILDRLMAITQVFGRGPWHPPLTFHVACRIGKKRQRMFHDLRVEPRGEE